MPQDLAQRLRARLQHAGGPAASAGMQGGAAIGEAAALSLGPAPTLPVAGIPAAGAAAAAAEGDALVRADAGASRKRKLTIRQGAGDGRSADLAGLEAQEEALVAGAQGDQRQHHAAQLHHLLSHHLASGQQQQQAAGQDGTPPPGDGSGSAGTAAALYGRPGSGMLAGLGQQQSGSLLQQGSPALQGGLPGAALAGGMPPGPGAGAALGGAGAAAAMGGAALPFEAGAGGARDDVFLLSQAYNSMTPEQKEKLAAQPPQVRQYVLRERMRKAREQLERMQAQQRVAAGEAAWGASGGRAATLQLAQIQQQQQPEWVLGGAAAAPALVPALNGSLAAQQPAPQASLQFAPSFDLGLQSQRLPSLRMGDYSGHLGAATQSPPLLQPQQQDYPQQQPQQQPPLPQKQQQAAEQAQGAPPGAPQQQAAAPFAIMSEVERLEHLRQLKRRQDEWLKQQRQAAAAMAGQNGA